MTRRHGARTRATTYSLVAICYVRLFLVSAAVDYGVHARVTRTICRDQTSSSAVRANGPARFITQATGDDGQMGAFEGFPHRLCVIPAPPPLSAQDRGVRGMMMHGLRDRGMDRHLFIGNRAVTWHARAIYRKLDVANRTGAVAMVLRWGGVDFDPPVPPVGGAA